jgi:sRNA-binding protein
LASQYAIERKRGAAESRQQLVALRERWPLAFPAAPRDVRPLTVGIAREIAAAMGWSLPWQP